MLSGRLKDDHCTYCGRSWGHSLACRRSFSSLLVGAILYGTIIVIFLVNQYLFGNNGPNWFGLGFFGVLMSITLLIKYLQLRRD